MFDDTRRAFVAALKKETHPGMREWLREMLKDAGPASPPPKPRRRPRSKRKATK